jgi:hypothetical protein
MFRSVQYVSGAELDYIPVGGVVSSDVIKVTRSGKDIRITTFDPAPLEVDVYSFEWYGVDTTITLDSGAYILQVYNSVTTFRTVLYEFGPTVGVGYVYVFKNGTNIASYAAAPLDDAEDVRDGIETALNAVSWGFSITTLAIGTNQLRVIFSNTEDFETFIGRSTYKTGYYCTIDGSEYLIYYDEDPTGYPVLPAIASSYEFGDLALCTPDLETYLDDPNSDNTFSEVLEDVTDINEVPGADSVPNQYCVVEDTEQRVYFWENLAIGEVIKIYQK